MQTITLYVLLVSLFSISFAHIVSISGPTTYQATDTSTYPLKFRTNNGPITNEDFSVAVGLQSASGAHRPPALGNFVKNYNLEDLGDGSTGTGSFTLDVPLPANRFSGSGSYVLTTSVTNAVGALWNVQLLFFNTTFTVSGV